MRSIVSSAPHTGGAPRVAEFFAGIGLARMGLEASGFNVVWANDSQESKQAMYLNHFNHADLSSEFTLSDIAGVSGTDLPHDLSVAWASFPCIDVSLAGWRRGFKGQHSSTFWQFTRVIDELGSSRPPVIVLENVVGFATSHGGNDLLLASRELNRLGYSVDVLALDARRFVPQSRPRLFVIGAQVPPTDTGMANQDIRPEWLQAPFENPGIRTHRFALPFPPPLMKSGFSDLAEAVPGNDTRWWDNDRTEKFLVSLSDIQRTRLNKYRTEQHTVSRTAYRRTRNGKPVWEIRPDDISGCLRTARGGSSKQAVVQAGNGKVRVRWMTPLEYARLMGAGEYNLEHTRTNQAYFGFGDAVCVPVVSWLGQHYLKPLLKLATQNDSISSLAAVASA